jgi:hypothetical protein
MRTATDWVPRGHLGTGGSMYSRAHVNGKGEGSTWDPSMPRARERVGVLGAAPGVELDSNTTVHCRNHYPGRRHAAGKATSLGCTH